MEKTHQANKLETQSQLCNNWRIFTLFSILILLAYCQTFNVPFQLDDFPNITNNTKLQIVNIYPETIYDAIFKKSETNGLLHRPISNLSIAVNWYLGKTDVIGYHIVNLGIHILTAFFLYLTLINIFKTPKLACRYEGDEYFIAVLAACLWAVNPIQTQAVTYIVQRMAAMAAMFYILGIYFYIKARTCHSWKKSLLLFFSVLISYLLAIGSKENAIMLPVSLLILELIFFQNMNTPETRKKALFFCGVLVLIVFIFGVFLFLNGDFVGSITKGYENRTFTLAERLMTEPRVVIFYLSQIFYPIADRLSVDHDIIVSTGLFSPWPTFPAMCLILFSLGTAFCQINKRPLISFAILFFFVNHIVESSVIPLELIFEHRNYLPSMFLFFPIAAALKQLLNYYMKKQDKKLLRMVLIFFITTLIIMLALGTYIRNMAWLDDKILWEDTIEKAPNRARAYQNLASGYYVRIRNYEKIMELSEKSLYLGDSTRYKAERISLSNIALVYASQNDYEKVIQIFNRILTTQPDHAKTQYSLVLALLKTGRTNEAMDLIDQLILKKTPSIQYLNIKSFILLKKNKAEEALRYLKKAVKIDPDDEMVIFNLGVAKKMLEDFISAEHYFKRIKKRSTKRINALFFLIENSLLVNDNQNAEKYAEMVVSEFSSTKILNSLEKAEKPGLNWLISVNLITPVIAKKIKNQSIQILEFRKSDEG